MFTNSLIESTLREDSMRDNSFDRTIERNYIQKWRFLIAEYEEVKAGRATTVLLWRVSCQTPVSS
jgi:hypothetical protein